MSNNNLIPVNIHYESSNSNTPTHAHRPLMRSSATRNVTKKRLNSPLETARRFSIGQKGNIKLNNTHKANKRRASYTNKNTANMQRFVKYLAHVPENQQNKIITNFLASRTRNNK
jgi:hypothetical protein